MITDMLCIGQIGKTMSEKIHTRAMNVLVVDDSKSMRHLIGAVLRQLGHRALTARDADAALQYFSDKRIDLVLVDVEMPGMDGFELTRELRTRLGNNWIPIVFLSSKQDAEQIEKGINAGGDDYLGKPINPTILKAKLLAMSRISDMRRELMSAQAQLASYRDDPLTGVPGKSLLIEKLLRVWREAQRSAQTYVAVRSDLDGLEQYNAQHGVSAGDELLARLGQRVRDVSPPDALFGRVDGDEFMWIWQGTLDDGHAWWKANQAALQTPVTNKATVSLMNPADFETLSEWLDFTAAQVSLA